jgi:large subunit ribosomal protein L25
MAAAQQMKAEVRAKAGTGAARATRRTGMVPGIVYGAGKEPQMVSLDPRDVQKGLNRRGFYASLVDLELDGKVQSVLPKKVQFHPVSDAPLHVDFLRVDATTRITVSVPVKLLNQDKCKGLKVGGTLNVVRHTVDVLCLAHNIPEAFEIDIAESKIGDAIKSKSINLPEGAKFLIADRDFTIATIVAPRGASADGE